ncbi:FAD-binding domain-containing protein [Cryphonectria parasitica EP155]|uniref:FAD-binding domain-containing protein n=1 Tax=Cryphonectria parasitica (strain ATCC 38755 / EP155) TaxID=660469 RepID=A0A9P5CNK9_CRYP1|nr:FAD-binding domain-containing protein [Cryphonectria parasitica EP155]KAF3764432.1 FAD-binding domain-containing protein [Cryphonectria parasitica EP155]
MTAVSTNSVAQLPSTAQLAITNLKNAGLSEVLHLQGTEIYEERLKSYWALTPRLRAWALVLPRTTEEVSLAVKALVGTPDCQFAIRSGGHMCSPGASGIENGIGIDLGLLAKITYDAETKLASVQPAPRWLDVYKTLEKDGVMVAGGREGLVGVGGLLLGGGLSNHTCRVGLACDQVVNYEVVLADGSIVNANETTNEDLFRALKGGGNNFGIVTRFDIQTFPACDVWDGMLYHPKTETPAVIDALVNLVDHLKTTDEPSEHYLGVWRYIPEARDISLFSILTQLDGAESTEPLKEFLSIPRHQGNMQKWSIAAKTTAFTVQSNQHSIWLSTCFKNDRRIARKAISTYEELIDHIKEKHIPSGEFEAMHVLQALPTSSTRLSPILKGNMLGLERLAGEAVILTVTWIHVPTWELAQAIFPKYKALLDELDAYAESLGGSVEFRYANYCDRSQNPLATYGQENIRKMREASKKYDPTGVFQTRVPGGFKISKVKTTE